MSSPYKCVLLVGATSGIGAALADKFVVEGSKVIAVGRRQERLDAFVEKHGSEKAASLQYDITDRAGLDGFIDKVVNEYHDLDCVFLNAGVQSVIKLNQPTEVDLDAFHQEMSTNFNRLVDLSIKFLPHLQKKSYPVSMIFTDSLLAHIPAFTMPAYAASKAALTAYVDCLRQQYKNSLVKIIDVWPPVVQTELHDYLGAEKGRSFGMPVAAFVRALWPQLVSKKERAIVGAIGPEESFYESVELRQKLFSFLSEQLIAHS